MSNLSYELISWDSLWHIMKTTLSHKYNRPYCIETRI